jgi:hypothetical protein
MTRDALSRVDLAPRLDIDSILPFAKLIVEHEWPADQLIAHQLMVHKTLDYEQVRALIYAAPV